MADEELLHKIQGLGDLDLAALLCLISREHCIIGTEPEAIDDLVNELQLVATETFNLKPTVVSLNASTSLDDFAASILLPVQAQTPSRSSSPLHARNPSAAAVQDSYFQVQHQHRTSALSPLTPLSTTTQAGAGAAAASPPTTTTTFSNNNNNNNNNNNTNPNLAAAALANPQIANVVLARDLDKAPKAVQIQALELLRTRRLFTRTSVQTAPKQFLFIAVLGVASGGEPIAGRLADHLNDFFYLAHWHDALDGFAHLEENALDGGGDDDDYVGGDGTGRRGESGYRNNDSDSSIVFRRPSRTNTPKNELPPPPQTPVHGSRPKQRSKGKKDKRAYQDGSGDHYNYTDAIDPRRPRRSNTATTVPATPPPRLPPPPAAPYITDADLTTLSLASRAVAVDVDVLRYQMNLVSFLRLHRAVGVGVSSAATTTTPFVSTSAASASTAGISPTGGPAATRALDLLVRGMAALHGLAYATPALVRLALRKVYLHRLRVVRDPAREERSVQWGTDAAAPQLLLDGVGPHDVMDDVEEMVEAPV